MAAGRGPGPGDGVTGLVPTAAAYTAPSAAAATAVTSRLPTW